MVTDVKSMVFTKLSNDRCGTLKVILTYIWFIQTCQNVKRRRTMRSYPDHWKLLIKKKFLKICWTMRKINTRGCYLHSLRILPLIVVPIIVKLMLPRQCSERHWERQVKLEGGRWEKTVAAHDRSEQESMWFIYFVLLINKSI